MVESQMEYDRTTLVRLEAQINLNKAQEEWKMVEAQFAQLKRELEDGMLSTIILFYLHLGR